MPIDAFHPRIVSRDNSERSFDVSGAGGAAATSSGISQQPTTWSTLSEYSNCSCLKKVWDCVSSFFQGVMGFFTHFISLQKNYAALNHFCNKVEEFVHQRFTEREMIRSGFSRSVLIIELNGVIIDNIRISSIERDRLGELKDCVIKKIQTSLKYHNPTVTLESEFSMCLLICKKEGAWQYSLYEDCSRGDKTKRWMSGLCDAEGHPAEVVRRHCGNRHPLGDELIEFLECP